MNVLLDECVPHDLRLEITGHTVETVAYRNWSGLGNGKLIRSAADAGFDVLITTDRGYQYQHDPTTLPLRVIILDAKSNDLTDLIPLVPALLKHLDQTTDTPIAVIEH